MTLTWEMVDAAAARLGATEAQRRKWRQTGRQVPDGWRIRIAKDLADHGQSVEFSAFDDLPPRPGRLSVHDDTDTGSSTAAAPGKAVRNSPRQGRAYG